MNSRHLARSRWSPTSFRPWLESLEVRSCPSCTMVMEGNTLFIHGDNTANNIDILQGLGTTVTCDGAAPAHFSGIDHLQIDTGDGDDRVRILIGLLPPTPFLVEADLGKGDDQFHLDAVGTPPAPPSDLPPPTLPPPAGTLEVRLFAGAGDDVVEVKGRHSFDVALDFDLGAGNDRAFVEVPSDPSVIPGKVRELQVNILAGAGNDIVEVMASGFFDVFTVIDLGAGNDTANLRYVGGGTPDPAGLAFTVLSGAGNDTINAFAAAFFSVDFQTNLGAGDDQLALTLNPDPSPFEDPTSIVHVIIDAGSGTDGVVLDVRHVTLEEILIDLSIITIGIASVDTLFPTGFLRLRETARDSRAASPSELALTQVGPDLAIDMTTGASDDLIQLEMDPAADGSVRFSAGTGGGDDNVNVTGSGFIDLKLGAGNDQAFLEFPSDPSVLELLLDAGDGNDQVTLAGAEHASGNWDLSLNLGAGNDKAFVELPSDPSTLEFLLDAGAGDDQVTFRYVGGGSPDPGALRLKILGGSGNDVLHADISARLSDPVFMDFDGGRGNDLIRVRYQESSTTALPAQPLHIHVLGDDGKDDLVLSVATTRPNTLLDLLLDGGAGFDRCWATPNVRVINCEDHLPSPPPDA